jgi:hypothetical protein
MKRRHFLSGTVGLLGTIAASRVHGQNVPCPPAEIGIVGGAKTATSCSPSALPAWIPANVGEASLVPTGNALQDVFVAEGPQNPGKVGSQFFCDYSGGIYNPYYGNRGAHVIHGGGHSATNDNSVFILDYNQPRPEFRRIAGPTRLGTAEQYETNIILGGFPDDPLQNPREIAQNEPGSAHTYDNLLVLPPSVCGDAMGALIRPVSSAVGVVASRETGWSHVLPFTSARWQRWSTNSARSPDVGGSCAYDERRGRIWTLSSSNRTFTSYLDTKSRTWVNNQVSAQGVKGYPDMAYSCVHQGGDIVIFATNADTDSALRLYWFRAGSDGTARTPVAFVRGELPPANWGRGSLSYCADLECVLYYSQADMDAYYELRVPSDPSQPWSFARRPIVGVLPSKLPVPPAGSTYRRLEYAPALKSLLWVTGAAKSQYHFGGQVLAIRVVS